MTTCSSITVHRNTSKGKNNFPEFIGHHKTQYALETTWDNVLPPIPAILPRLAKSMLQIGDKGVGWGISTEERRGVVVLGFFSTGRIFLTLQ